MEEPVVIVGAGPAAIAAVEAIRRAAGASPIILVGAEGKPVYCRCLLAQVVAGKTGCADLDWRPETFYRQMGVECLWGEPAVGLDPEARVVELEGGRRLHYKTLLLATGAAAIRPLVPGADLAGIYTLRTCADARALEEACRGARRAVVVGGGLVGLGAAEALAARGLAVTVLEAREHLLPEQFDRRAGEMLAAAFAELGVEVRCGAAVRAFVPSPAGKVAAVELEGGEALACDVVVAATGVRPNTALAARARVGRGVAVDERMKTTLPDVYAAGDVAEVFDPLVGRAVVPGTWNAAVEQGRVAGMNMAGVSAVYRPALTLAHSGHLAGLPFVALGLANAPLGDGYEVEVVYRKRPPLYRRLAFAGGRLVGALLVGDVSRAGAYLACIAKGLPVDESLKEGLLRGRASFPLKLPEKKGACA